MSDHTPNAETIAAIEAGERGEVTRFDPTTGDAEMLAILLWDYFGPYSPRTPEEIQQRSFKASALGVAQYRECAKQIAESLRFYRNIQFDQSKRREREPKKPLPTDK